jgi:PhoH-like ATPase
LTDPTLRTFVLDTNVLLYDPNALFVFDEHDVVIPMTVIEEIDRFKKDVNETGRNARQVSRLLDDLRMKGSLRDGVPLAGGGVLRVDFSYGNGVGKEAPLPWGPATNDNRILETARRLNEQDRGGVALITRDTNMRLKSDAMGIKAEDYRHARIDVDEQFTGLVEATVDDALVDRLYAEGSLPGDLVPNMYPQQFVVLHAASGGKKAAMARKVQGELKLVGRHKEGVWGIFARNREQLFALELLMDESIRLVTLNGVAGTGKTLLAVACGLQRVADERLYRKMLISRPIFPLGRDIGFLPGDIEQKLNPWMKPIFDNLELIFSSNQDHVRGRGGNEPRYQHLMDRGIIEVEPLTYIRGRSITGQILIVDEAQNLTPHEVKTVLTRAGEGTKVILTGDPYQIDNPYVDSMSNGLTYAVERFKNAEIAGHVTLRKGERSALAELAAEVL